MSTRTGIEVDSERREEDRTGQETGEESKCDAGENTASDRNSEKNRNFDYIPR